MGKWGLVCCHNRGEFLNDLRMWSGDGKIGAHISWYYRLNICLRTVLDLYRNMKQRQFILLPHSNLFKCPSLLLPVFPCFLSPVPRDFMFESLSLGVYFDFAIVKKWKGLKLGAGAIQEGVAILIKRTWKREPRKSDFPSFEAFSRFSC